MDFLKKDVWIERISVLLYSGIFASIGNWIFTMKDGKPIYPHEVIPAMLMMFGIIVVGCFLEEFCTAKFKLKLPNIIYISVIAIILGLPAFPGSTYFITSLDKIGLLPLCTPILAYAGISLGKDLGELKKQGIGIIVVALMALSGTYIASAFIAQLILKLTNQI